MPDPALNFSPIPDLPIRPLSAPADVPLDPMVPIAPLASRPVMQPIKVVYPASPVGADGIPFATVTISDTAPPARSIPPMPSLARKAWWQDPLALGLMAGGLLLLVLLVKKE